MKEKIINFRYVFYPFLAFFLGIVVSRKLYAGSLEIILLVLGLFAGLTTFLLIKKSYKPLAILFAFFFLGNGFYYLGETAFNTKEYSSQVAVVGRVTDEMTEHGFYIEVVLDEVKIDGKSQENLRLSLKNCSTKLNIGDFVAFESYVEKSKPFTLGQFNSSDLRSGVRYRAEVSYNNVVFTEGYTKVDEKVRLAVKDKLYQHMSEKNAGISYAVLFGDKSGLDEDVELAYKSSGIIHVLTVSGLHVGFLVSLVYFLLKLCKANRYVRFVVTTIFIFFYAYLCGFTPSVMRAGIMSIVLMLSKIFMRRYDSLNSLGVAGFLICLFSPLTALDMGFQMSFFCVAGILIISPTLTRVFAKFIPCKIASLLALSISAQIGIMPILANFSVSVNMLSVFANLIVVPLFSILYPFLFLISFLSTFLSLVGHLLCLADYTFIFINAIANFFGTTNLYIAVSPFKTAISTLYFIALFAIGKFVMSKSFVKFALFCSLALITTLTFGFYLIPQKSENVVSYIGNKTSASVIIENDNGEMLVIGESYMLSRYVSQYGVDKIDGFVALDYLGNDDMESLIESGVQNFLGNFKNANNKYFTILHDNVSYSFGDYKLKFLSNSSGDLGVSVSIGGHKIFVASSEKIDYNSLKINETSPNIIFIKSGEIDCEDMTVVSMLNGVNSDYSIAGNGNMSFRLEGETWVMRGLD